jgi:hypothetical protein
VFVVLGPGEDLDMVPAASAMRPWASRSSAFSRR